jgi:rRNA-processing protein FCF1
MKRILLDTNALLMPEQFKVDIFEDLKRVCNFNFEIYVVKQTIKELEKIKEEGNMNDRRAAAIGLGLIKAKDLKILDEKEGYTDDVIVDLAKEGFIIVTADKELKKRLKSIGAEHITLRQTKHLIFVNKTKGI